MIQSNLYDTMQIGQPFTQEYITKFDFSKNTVGFAPNFNAVEGIKIKKHFNTPDIILISIGGFIVFVVFVAVCIKVAGGKKT